MSALRNAAGVHSHQPACQLARPLQQLGDMSWLVWILRRLAQRRSSWPPRTKRMRIQDVSLGMAIVRVPSFNAPLGRRSAPTKKTSHLLHSTSRFTTVKVCSETSCFPSTSGVRLKCQRLRGEWNPHRRVHREGGSAQRTIYPAVSRPSPRATATSSNGKRRDRSQFVMHHD